MDGMGKIIAILVQLVTLFFLLRFLWKLIRRLIGGVQATKKRHDRKSSIPFSGPSGKTFRDPVCGMFVSTELSYNLKLGSGAVHFCSAECMKKYQEQKSS